MYIKHVELYVKKPCVCACAYTNIYNILHHICDFTGAWMYVYVCVSERLHICMHCARMRRCACTGTFFTVVILVRSCLAWLPCPKGEVPLSLCVCVCVCVCVRVCVHGCMDGRVSVSMGA